MTDKNNKSPLDDMDAEQLKADMQYEGDAEDLRSDLVELLQPEIDEFNGKYEDGDAEEATKPTIPAVIDSPEKANEAASAISDMDVAALKVELKNQILEELKDDQTKRMEQEKMRRDRETLEQQAYVNKMKESPDPWVDIVGWVRSSEGVNVELEWNEAFVDYLRTEGITGTDDNALVQKWVALLMRDMAEQMDDNSEEESEFGG